MSASALARSSPPARRRRASEPDGATRFGEYLLHERLGQGGMAVVHRAVSRKPESLGRVVALKQLLPQNEFDFDFDIVRSFIEEARLATRFHHPNVANTFSLGKTAGTYFIEMEYVPGPTLLQVARQCELAAGAMPVAVTVQILIQICDALEHIHGLRDDHGKPLKLVHRDVSPSNIIISDAGIVKLIDFGIVKGHSAQASTLAGTIKGKLAYIAPEYLIGRLDQRSDLYAFGVIAHEMLTDRRLFCGRNDLDTLARVRNLRISPPSESRADVPAGLDAIVMTALQREPDRRWQTAREMRDALAALQESAGGPELIDVWTTWAMSQEPRVESSELLETLDSLGELTVEVDLATQLVDPPAVVVPVAPAGVPATPRYPATLTMIVLFVMLVATIVALVHIAGA